MPSIAIETRKCRHEWLYYAVVIAFVALNVANGVFNYIRNSNTFVEEGIDWAAIWGQGGLLWSSIFLPFALSLYCGMLCSIEGENGNWQRLASYGLAQRSYYAKLAKAALFALAAQLAFFFGVGIGSMSIGFVLAPSAVWTMFSWAAAGWLGSLCVCSIQLYAGLFIFSYPLIVGVGVIGSFAGLAIELVSPSLRWLYPYAQILVGNHVRELGAFSASQVLEFVFVCLLFIVLPAVLAVPRLRAIGSRS